MELAWGMVLVVLGLLAWLGQTLSRFATDAATRLKLVEKEGSVEPVFWADIRGEALWDFLTLWTLAVAGVLLVFDHQAWPYFGLIGGSVYVYFAGRGILTRVEMQRSGFRVGEPENVRLGLVMLGVWGAAGLITLVASVNALTS